MSNLQHAEGSRCQPQTFAKLGCDKTMRSLWHRQMHNSKEILRLRSDCERVEKSCWDLP